jgi:D-threo-aldose 1-dehydrogenase
MIFPLTKTLTTSAGATLSFTSLGFGGAQIGNMGCVLDEAEARATIQTAWSRGLRYFDTAPLYGLGLSEQRIGAALRGHQRDSFLISSKVGLELRPAAQRPSGLGPTPASPSQDSIGVYAYDYDAVMRSYEASLARLGASTIDILLVHDIDADTHGSSEVAKAHLRALVDGGGWRALDELRRTGSVKAIGAGLNEWETSQQLLSLLDPDIFLLAGRYTLLEQSSLDSFLPNCAAKGVGVIVGGPFNSGVLATGAIKNARYNYQIAPAWVLERVASIEAVCRDHGVALAQAALHFPLGHPVVVSVIPGSITPKDVERNADMLNRPVPKALWADLKSVGLLRTDAPTPGEEPAG